MTDLVHQYTDAGGIRGMTPIYDAAADALAGIEDGDSIAVGGFGLCGIPMVLLEALLDSGAKDLHVISNNCGTDEWGLGLLLREGRISMMTSSYVGENKEFARRYLEGELTLHLTPQGTLAEKLRAGGAGIPAFYTPAGVGTQVAEGGLPQRFIPGGGEVAMRSSPKPTEIFSVFGEPQEYVLEEALAPDAALVHALRGDADGNLVYDKTAQQFSPLAAAAGRISIAQVEELVAPGDIDPNHVHTPGIYIDGLIEVGTEVEKRIEKLTTQERE